MNSSELECVLPPTYTLSAGVVDYCIHISCVCLSESQSVEWSESFLFACVCSYVGMGSHTARCPRCLVGPTIAPFLALLHELPLAGVGLAGVKKLGSM